MQSKSKPSITSRHIPRWLILLPVLSGVLLYSFFPQLFIPSCNGPLRALAQCEPVCEETCHTICIARDVWGRCYDSIEKCKPNPASCACPPVIVSASLTCAQWGDNGYCISHETFDITASDPQG
jgi:hypothetical protein